MDNGDVRKASFEEVNAKLDAILGVMDNNITLISDTSTRLEEFSDKASYLDDAAGSFEDNVKALCEQRSSMSGSMSDSWEKIENLGEHLPDDINHHMALVAELNAWGKKKEAALDDPKTSNALLDELTRDIEQMEASTAALKHASEKLDTPPIAQSSQGSLFVQSAVAASLGVCVAFIVNHSSQATGLTNNAQGSGYLFGAGVVGVGGAFIRQRFFSDRNIDDTTHSSEQEEKAAPNFS